MLIILTAVEKVAVNFRKENERWLDTLTPEQAKAYAAEGQFAPGSMLPKVEAAVKFAESKPGREERGPSSPCWRRPGTASPGRRGRSSGSDTFKSIKKIFNAGLEALLFLHFCPVMK